MMSMLDPALASALDELRSPDGRWAHVATTLADGGPHVTPMLLGRNDEHLLLSLTGARKRDNLRRDPRVAISLARPQDMAHIVVWGTVDLRDDGEAQKVWEDMMTVELGPDVASGMRRQLSPHTTMLGIVNVTRHRIYGFEDLS